MNEEADHLEISCRSCGATILVEPLLRTARCAYCDSPSVIDRPASPDRPDPVFVIGFFVDRHEATQSMRECIGRKKQAPFGLKPEFRVCRAVFGGLRS